MIDKKELISVCPYCNNIVFRGGELEIKAKIGKNPNILSFKTKCPNPACQKIVRVEINLKAETKYY